MAVAIDATGNSVLALTRTLERHGQSDRPAGRAGGLERRATAAPAGAAAALRNAAISATAARRSRSSRPTSRSPTASPPSRPSISKGRRSGSGWPARPRSRRAISICAGSPRSPPPAPTTPPAFELPFVVQGPWDDPIMLPDTQSPDPALAGGEPAAQRGAQPQHPRHRALGDRAADRRRRQPAGRRARRRSRSLIAPARLDAAATARAGARTPFRL